jgi:hypothetical protein
MVQRKKGEFMMMPFRWKGRDWDGNCDDGAFAETLILFKVSVVKTPI